MFNFDNLFNLKHKAIIDYFKRMLPNNAGKHKDIIQRLSNYLQTEDDLIKIASLINDIYAEGYSTAISHCKSKLEERGIKFSIHMESKSNFQS